MRKDLNVRPFSVPPLLLFNHAGFAYQHDDEAPPHCGSKIEPKTRERHGYLSVTLMRGGVLETPAPARLKFLIHHTAECQAERPLHWSCHW